MTMTPRRPAERRQFPRVACHAALQYRQVLRPDQAYHGGLSKDVSAGGLRFEVPQCLPVRSRLLLEFSLPPGRAPMRLIAQVAWVAQRPRAAQYDVGAQFVELTPEDRAAVVRFVEQGLGRSPSR